MDSNLPRAKPLHPVTNQILSERSYQEQGELFRITYKSGHPSKQSVVGFSQEDSRRPGDRPIISRARSTSFPVMDEDFDSNDNLTYEQGTGDDSDDTADAYHPTENDEDDEDEDRHTRRPPTPTTSHSRQASRALPSDNSSFIEEIGEVRVSEEPPKKRAKRNSGNDDMVKRSRPRLADFQQSTRHIIEYAQVIYRNYISFAVAFPDEKTTDEFCKIAWSDALEKFDTKADITPDIVRLVRVFSILRFSYWLMW